MATFTIYKDSNFEYVKNIVITTDYNINIHSQNFKIEVKDLFEHFYSDYFTNEFGLEECLKYDITPTLIIDNNNVDVYNNSTYDDLIRNGIQFYCIQSKKLVIRIAGAGKNNINGTGYNTGYVGFCAPELNITLNDNENLYIKTFIFPIIQSEPPIPEEDPPAPTGVKAQILPENVSRTGYEWNNSNTKNDLYVNNSSATSSYKYEDYEASNDTPIVYTQNYVVKSSAIVNDYLLSGETYDIFTSATKTRNFNFEDYSDPSSGILKSYIYNEYDGTSENLPFTCETTTISNYPIVKSNQYVLSSDLHCFEIIQAIKTSSTEPKVRKNIVKLDFEV